MRYGSQEMEERSILATAARCARQQELHPRRGGWTFPLRHWRHSRNLWIAASCFPSGKHG